MSERLRAIATGFRAQFGREPHGVWSSPGRVTLIGDHTDHQGGLALPFAIDRHTLVAAAPRVDGILRVASAQRAGEMQASPVGTPPDPGSWTAYPLGVGFVLHEEGLATGGADLWIDSTVPAGSGLSSSAALTCSTALALLGLAGVELPRARIARVAQRAEADVVGAPVGLLDQTAVLFAAPGSALLVDFGPPSPSHAPIALPGPPWLLAVVDTRVRHSHAADGYADRRRLLDQARQRLRVGSLSRLDPEGLAGHRDDLDTDQYAAVRHVVSENARVRSTVAALADHDVTAVGELMVRSHESLRDDLRVSCPELDLAVTASLDAGAAGARMTGGGFGGAVIVLGAAAVVDALPDRLDAEFRSAGLGRPDVVVVRAAGPAGRAPGD